MPDTDLRPVFLSTDAPVPEAEDRADRAFERLVNADLRDKFAAGPAYKILSRPENLVHWLRVLTDIQRSIQAQNAHDNAALRSHPDRPDGGQTPQSYIDAKKAIDERKRSRERAMQAVVGRMGEVQRLIGADPLAKAAAGLVAQRLVDIDLMLRDGEIEDARGRIGALLRMLNGQGARPDA